MFIPIKRSTKLFVRYGDGYDRTLHAHVGKNTRRVFVAGKYMGTERKLGIPGGNYRSLADATAKSTINQAA
jgi:hypothetical protein